MAALHQHPLISSFKLYSTCTMPPAQHHASDHVVGTTLASYGPLQECFGVLPRCSTAYALNGVLDVFNYKNTNIAPTGAPCDEHHPLRHGGRHNK